MTNCNNIGVYDINCLIQNQDFTTVLTWESDSDPLDLTIYDEIFFDVFKCNKRIIRKTIGDGIEISGDDNNVLTISLKKEDTILINREGITHEIRMLNAQNQNNYLIKGSFVDVNLTKSR